MSGEDRDSELVKALLDNRYHAKIELTRDQHARSVSIRNGARLFGRHLAAVTPCSWERDRALEALDEAVLWSEAAIRRNE